MGELYGMNPHGHWIGVEPDDSGLVRSCARLLVDGRQGDERETLPETSLQVEIYDGEWSR